MEKKKKEKGGGELSAEKRALAILTRPTDSAAARVTVANLQSRSIVR